VAVIRDTETARYGSISSSRLRLRPLMQAEAAMKRLPISRRL